ncbi:tetratricopeptide repeat protein [Acanthopleuribacter pedis]|uniref:SEL1-like repeat protein n=1 Tax=Acanthopleuribacter pedis TaxID=442870 RepID=A0A8J7QDR9_9BACT|nr:SEL1-like repeat protein [Acanthopleuribacter pedis]MBO1321934.1 SEL1-like repeat protein [Acanthopleuribacter pedis]
MLGVFFFSIKFQNIVDIFGITLCCSTGAYLGFLLGESSRHFFKDFVLRDKLVPLVYFKLRLKFGFHLFSSFVIACSLFFLINLMTRGLKLPFDVNPTHHAGVTLVANNQSAPIAFAKQENRPMETTVSSAKSPDDAGPSVVAPQEELIAYLEGLNIDEVRRNAKAGDPEAQYALGMMNQLGVHKRRSAFYARKWLRKAARQGHQQAGEALNRRK